MNDEPIIKKRNIVDRILSNQILVTGITMVLMIFVIIGSSYAIFSRSEEIVESVVIKTGNLEAVLMGDEKGIDLEYKTLGSSSVEGLAQDPYNFKIKNTGKLPINYYEIRIVDKEYEITTLPHKFINYVLKVNEGEYSNINNLGENNSYIYTGGSLSTGEEDSFSLKLWADNLYGDLLNDKTANLSLEVILYSDIPNRDYLIYDMNGGDGIIPNTNILLKQVSSVIPTREGYTFVGWSKTKDGAVDYKAGANYTEIIGTTLYAIWEKAE